MNNKELQENRSYNIVKRNDLIQKSRMDLTAQEQKIILYLTSKIKPEDIELEEYTFQIADFCKVCGLDSNSGSNYSYIKRTLKGLRDKSIWITLENNAEVTLAWFDYVIMFPKSGTATLKISKFMKPYLLQLKEKFTVYSLYFILAMKSKYSIRIYELLKSYQNLEQCEFEIEQLKAMLFAENYKTFDSLKRKVVDVAIDEINDYSDLYVTYELEKLGRKFHKIKFSIVPKFLDGDESWETVKRIEQILSN